MTYKILLSLIVLIGSGAAGAAAAAEDSRYRVELLVLTHLDHDEPPREVAIIEDFSDALDFLTPPGPGDGAGRAPARPAVAPTDPDTAGLAGMAGEEGLEDPACAVVPVTEMGPEMQEAWRRLRLSRPFRPLQFLAWEQPGVPPFPSLRLHDREAVLTDDPWRALRDAAGDGRNLAAGGPLPSPIQQFRLDGRTRLVRTRFLHLAVTVEVREPVFDSVPAPQAPESLAAPAEPRPTSFLVHRLDQRRQVRTGRMEYFDGPVLGVLAFVTDISDTLEDPPPDEP